MASQVTYLFVYLAAQLIPNIALAALVAFDTTSGDIVDFCCNKHDKHGCWVC